MLNKYHQVVKANERIKPYLKQTPMLYSAYFSECCGSQVYLKTENLQHTGAFKIRGALNKILSLNDHDLMKGVVCASAGNHAQGVAFAAKLLKTQATIVMPLTTPNIKVEASRILGGHVILHGKTFDEANAHARHLAKAKGLTMVHPFDDIDVIAGQGTLGLDILKDLPTCDMVLVPVGGGGLLAGLLLALKATHPHIKVVGVEPMGAAGMFQSFYLGNRMTLNGLDTLAEGAAVLTPGWVPYQIVRDLCDDMVVVSEQAIKEAVWHLMTKEKLIVEYAGALALAALNQVSAPSNKVVC